MKKLLILLGVAVSVGSPDLARPVLAADSETLFRIMENGKTGYINASGRQVIAPRFNDAGNFSEDLAAARLHGTYGYVDKTGNFAIAPAFDFATDFSEGLAVVYRNGIPAYIDKTGKEPFKVQFMGAGSFKNGLAEVRTKTRKMGYINKQGQLVIDTVFAHIGDFRNGLAVVQDVRKNQPSETEEREEDRIAVIDLKGRFVVPYGKYSSIREFHNGYACVEIPARQGDEDGITARSGVINKKGELLFSIDWKERAYLDGDVHNGLVKLYLSKTPNHERGSDNTYQGFINLKGDVIFKDTTYEYVNDFSENRAFVKDQNRKHFLIDNNGRLVSTTSFEEVLGNGFNNGVAFVKTETGWGAIDVNGNFMVQPVFENIEYPGLLDNYFFFSTTNGNEEPVYGMADKQGNIILKPRLQQFSREGFKNGLLAAQIDRKLCYLNTQGQVIWQENSGIRKSQALDLDFMNRGYFRAYSAPDRKHKDELGGYAGSGNYPQKIAKAKEFTSNKLTLVAQPENKASWFENYDGFKLVLVNNTKNDIEFDAQDSRLNIKLQALDRDGKWKDIEYLPSSWCGNSYHTITLDAKHFWAFTAPVYQGEFKTRLRAELTYPDPADKLTRKERMERQQKEIVLYSNEFEGSVNPGQFWRKREYFPAGIMDPYNE